MPMFQAAGRKSWLEDWALLRSRGIFFLVFLLKDASDSEEEDSEDCCGPQGCSRDVMMGEDDTDDEDDENGMLNIFLLSMLLD